MEVPFQYDRLAETLRTELGRCRDEFILEHFQKYDSPEFPPSWKTLEVASFGTLSKLYNNTPLPAPFVACYSSHSYKNNPQDTTCHRRIPQQMP